MNISAKIQAADAAAEIAAMPLEQLNPAKVSRFYDDTIWPVFEPQDRMLISGLVIGVFAGDAKANDR